MRSYLEGGKSYIKQFFLRLPTGIATNAAEARYNLEHRRGVLHEQVGQLVMRDQ